jgi:hypothetical protein
VADIELQMNNQFSMATEIIRLGVSKALTHCQNAANF